MELFVTAVSVGQDSRLDRMKLKVNAAAYGAEVKWHRDFSIVSHAHDDVRAIGPLTDRIGILSSPCTIYCHGRTGGNPQINKCPGALLAT